MITPLGIITAIFALAFVARILDRFKKQFITRREAVLWSLLWLGVGFLALFPDIIHPLAVALDVDTGTDLVFFVSILIIFWLMFRIFVRIEKIERGITKVVREIALSEGNQERQTPHQNKFGTGHEGQQKQEEK